MNRKIITLILLAVSIMSMTGCFAGQQNETMTAETQVTETQTETGDIAVQPDLTATAATKSSKTLVAYFAYSENMTIPDGAGVDAITSASLNDNTENTEGNLQVMAQEIESRLGADVFHILVEEPYEMDYSTMINRARQELDNEDWPALQASVEAIDDYDVIYLGVPVWYSSLPPALHTFLAEHDLSGKQIVLFGIHLGSRLGRMESQLQELVPDAEIIQSYTTSADTSNEAVRTDFARWLEEIQP